MFLGKFIKIPKFTLSPGNCWSGSIFKNNGISLIETLIALTILIIGVLAIVQLFPLGLKASQQAKNITLATNLAQAKIEEIISEEYDQVGTGNTYEPSLISSGDDFSNYARLTIVHYVDQDLNQIIEDQGLKKVEVQVGWADQFSGNTVTTTLTTLIVNL